MIPLTITEKKGKKTTERTILIPCLWSEVTLGQFMYIVQEKELDAVKLLACLSGLSEEYLMNVPASSLSVAANYVFFMKEVPDFTSWKLPEKITIDGVVCNVPKDIRTETFGQKIYLHEEMNRVITAEKKNIDAMPYALATYFYTQLTGDKKYTHDKVMSIIPRVMNTLAMEAVPVANFFLINWVKSVGRKNYRSLLSQLRRKSMQELITSISTELQTPSMHLHRAMS